MMSDSEPLPGWFVALGEQPIPTDPNETPASRAAHARRREQVRRAQRSHRERKDKYIKSLEAEVIKLRERDAAYDQDVKAYELVIQRLKELLIAHNVLLPPDLAPKPVATISFSVYNLSNGVQNLRANMASTGRVQPRWSNVATPSPSSINNTLNESRVAPGAARSQSSVGVPHPQQLPTPGPQDYTPEDLLALQIAIDFVLDLEQPCLEHHRVHEYPDNETNGHALMLQSPILTRCPCPVPTHAKAEIIPTDVAWNVPAWEIEKLLKMSQRLSLEGEITPVEAWNRIRSRPGFSEMVRDRPRMDALKTVLMQEIACYGLPRFGAVMDEMVFESILQEHFPHARSS